MKTTAKLISLTLILLLVNLLLPSDIVAKTRTRKPRPPRLKNNNKIHLIMSYDYSDLEKTKTIRLVTALPKTIPNRQRIYSIEYNRQPNRVFSANGNDYAEFVFADPNKDFDIRIDIKAMLLKYDLFTARRRQKTILADDAEPNEFLIHEKNIEKDDPFIREIAHKIKNGDNLAATIKNIFDYIIHTTQYINDGKSSGALYVASKRTGECSEYADLFVALCRAKDIPARTVSGYINYPGIVPRHAWAEVYFEKHGWVPFDPTWADVIRKSADDFHKLKPVYIYLNHTRNDPVLNNRWYACWSYRGEEPKIKYGLKFK